MPTGIHGQAEKTNRWVPQRTEQAKAGAEVWCRQIVLINESQAIRDKVLKVHQT